MGKLLLSSLILIVTVIASIVLYIMVCTRYSDVVWDFIAFLCAITFFLGLGIFISALIMEKALKKL